MVSPELLIAIASAFASLGTAVFLNRRRINEIRSWAFGRERDSTDDGVVGKHRSINDRLDDIESCLEENREQREQAHETVEEELRDNRRFVYQSIENLTYILNKELDETTVDPEAVKPPFPDLSDEFTDSQPSDD